MAIDRQQLIQRVQEIEGLSDDERAGLLQLLREQKKYGIVWEDKPEEAEQRLAAELPVLTEVKERYIAGATPDAPNHILIEGDNLHALTALSYTHEGKIDVIYIDPPYNTGNKDFVYNDSFVDREDGYRHSKWLSFMSRRLKIAKRLLSDRGVIFISIDDNEQAQLKLLCDEVFGEQNFVANLIWQSTPGSNTGTDIKTVTEYVLIYAKFKENILFNTRPIADDSKYKLADDYVDTRGKYTLNKMDRRMTGGHYSEALNYPITMEDGSLLFPGCTTEKQEHWNWRWSQTKLEWGIANGFIVIKKSKGEWAVYFKQYQFVDNNDNSISRELPYQNLLLDETMNSARGTKEVMEVFNNKAFDYPKPLSLLHIILEMSSHTTSTILDFFAGSGTTLHATMQLNAEDGGRRQCILVTNNENGICENVTYERNRRVIQGYTTPKGVAVAGLADNTLRYYRTDFVPNDTTIRNKRRLMELSTDMLCIKNNLYCEQDEFAGRRLNKQKMRYFTAQTQSSGNKSMLVVYDEQVVDTLVDVLAEMDVKQKIMIYVFSNTSYPHTDNFEEVLTKVELCALPSAILNAYKKIYRT